MTEHPLEPLAVSVATEADRVVVTVVGEVDTASAGRLEAELSDALARSDGDLALDLSGVRFLDSAGLRTLIVAQQAIAERGGSVQLIGSSPLVDRLLEMTGLQELFPRA